VTGLRASLVPGAIGVQPYQRLALFWFAFGDGDGDGVEGSPAMSFGLIKSTE
jgi:hypothetical protein